MQKLKLSNQSYSLSLSNGLKRGTFFLFRESLNIISSLLILLLLPPFPFFYLSHQSCFNTILWYIDSSCDFVCLLQISIEFPDSILFKKSLKTVLCLLLISDPLQPPNICPLREAEAEVMSVGVAGNVGNGLRPTSLESTAHDIEDDDGSAMVREQQYDDNPTSRNWRASIDGNKNVYRR